ncbi:MAG: cytochrome P450 [Rickettsiales bacterium]|nr:cytochrome P450 [Pseudomonadota bacterium]MDA0965529.1 cytochrome P450 [Pseudomonadota bacterium]MDG4542853.1 cytochrome P450 [Rickettsiales bacterium]MDG4544699.1 cytochrome P450 [Rickettsiales bacterium]MDG4546821.1 cytochrome P450 [Rickettsiales bacterium]
MSMLSQLKENIDEILQNVSGGADNELVQQVKKAIQSEQTELFTELLKNEPDKLFSVLRKISPILKTQNGYMITLFDDVQEALTRNDVFTVAPYAPKMDPSVGPYMLARDNTEINYRDKSIMRVVLRMNDLPKIRDMVKKYTDKALDESNGSIEVVSKISRGVPIRVTQDYFGFNAEEKDLFKWSYQTQADMFHNLTNDEETHKQNIAAGSQMKEFLSGEIVKRRKAIKKDPSLDDSFSRLIKIVDGSSDSCDFDDERIITNVMGLLVGGVETTSQAIVQILDQLIRVFPEKLEEAKGYAKSNDSEKFDAYVWEALRFNPINPFVARLSSQDYVLAAGTPREAKIPKGSVCLISTRSAMRDEKQIPDAESFKTDRPNYHYMHLGFGAHECLGKYVGMVEITEIVKQIILRDNLKVKQPIEFTNGSPFPEKYILSFN